MNTITQSISLNGQTLQIEGTIEQPLFKCSDVLIRLLGYKESNKNRFYHDNKSIHKYIRTLSICEGIDTNLYFTELGLYRCLFTSKKEVAVEFQELVAQLLIDIRNDNIELLLKKQCETSDLLQSKNNEIFNYITENQNLQQQVNDLSIKLEKTAQNIVIYQKQLENGSKYNGSTNNMIQRDKQHQRNSSNKHIKRAYSNNEIIRTKSLINVKCYNKEDIKFIERLSIDMIPKQQLLNIQLPQFNIERVTFNENQIEQIKEQLIDAQSDQYEDSDIDEQSIINEVSCIDEYDNDDFADIKWLSRFKELEQYTIINNKLPSYCSSITEVKSLSNWCSVQRQYKAINHRIMTQYRQDMLEQISIWKWCKQFSWIQMFELFKKFMQNNTNYPRIRSEDKLEKLLGRWVDRQRQAKKGKYTYILPIDREQMLNSINFIFDVSYDWNACFDKVYDFISENNRLPLRSSLDQNEHQNAIWLKSQKQHKQRNLLTDIQINLLVQLPKFKFETKHIWEDVYLDVSDFIIKNKHLPSRTSKNIDEKYLAQWIHDQQSSYRNQKINDDKQRQLLLLPGFKWSIPKLK